MTIQEILWKLKKVISMICDLLPVVFNVIKEVIILIRDIKTV